MGMRDKSRRTKKIRKRRLYPIIKPKITVRTYKNASYNPRVINGIRKLSVILRDVQAGATLNKRTVERILDNLRRLYKIRKFSSKTINYINDMKCKIEAASKDTTLKPSKSKSPVKSLHEPSKGTYCPQCDMKYLKVFHDEFQTRTEHCTFCGYKNEVSLF